MTANIIVPDDRGLILTCPQCGQRNRMIYERLGRTFRCSKCQTELRSAGDPIEVKSEAAFDALTGRSALPVVVDFWASWCGPCKMMAPELAKVAVTNADRWIIAKVSTEELPGIAQRFRISAIPTLAVFKTGREIGRQAGAMLAPAIQQFVEQTISGTR